MLLAEFAPLALIAIAPTGVNKLQSLCASSSGVPNNSATIWVPESCAGITGTQVYNTSLKKHVVSLWQNQRAFVFCLATGVVVRLIAPLLEDKSRDPAVVVIDEKGQFVISLCSGHQGGGDRLAQLIATQLGATPILTGASASLEL